MMRERPILFSAPMVRAILDGRKAQTRRIVQIPSIIAADINDADTASERNGLTTIAWLDQHEGGPGFYGWLSEYPEEGSISLRCPYGVPGDRLWVRETFCDDWREERGCIECAADGGMDTEMFDAGCKWRPSIYMPRLASRITLEVVSVRVERVQAVSHDDAVSEGMSAGVWRAGDGAHRRSPLGSNAVKRFAILWDELNFARGYGWDANPWVWRIEFRRVMPNASLTGAEPAGEASGRSDS